MKVLSIKGNKVNFDFTQEEYDILLRYGLQKWIDKKIGKNKVKVVPPGLKLLPDVNLKAMKKIVEEEIEETDKFCNELITLSVVAAIKEGISRESVCDCGDNCGDDCKCK